MTVQMGTKHSQKLLHPRGWGKPDVHRDSAGSLRDLTSLSTHSLPYIHKRPLSFPQGNPSASACTPTLEVCMLFFL